MASWQRVSRPPQPERRLGRRNRDIEPLNNNRGSNNNSNNRRRGRGNRQQGGGGGGGQQLNRIDSRARGNAPQLLEKYRKLAHDAHLNGDRVQAEYYLQFADHYFRVIADARVRQEEQRRPRDERWQEGDDTGDDNGDFSVEADFPSFEQPSYPRRERDERPRQTRPAQDEDSSEDEDNRSADAEPQGDDQGEPNAYEPPQNPFVRENRGTRGLKPRREDRRPRRDERDAPAAEAEDAPAALDPASLPPAISIPRSDVGDSEDEAPAKPRRGRPRRKPSADDAGEALESVN